jgi:hypothetical protein
MLLGLKRNIIFLIVLFFAILVMRCDKTPVGYDELARDLSNPVFNEFRPTARYCYGKYSPLGDANYLVLGRNSEYESRILMKFAVDDSSVNLDSVVKVKLVLYPKRYNNISFQIHPIETSSEWKENTATWKRMDEAVPWMTDGGDYYPTVLANTTLSSDSCIIELPLNKLDTLVNHSWGIIFIAIASDTGFTTINSRSISGKSPKLVFKFRDSSITSYVPNQDCHIIDTLNLILPPTDLWLGAGFPFRTMLKFTLDTIPENVTIAYAELTINIHSHYSMSDTLSIGVWKVLEPGLNSLTKFADNISNQTQYIASTDTTVTFDIRQIVQFWNTKPDSNFGILLSVYPENYEISRVRLKTGTYLPNLKVGYILPPTGRF